MSAFRHDPFSINPLSEHPLQHARFMRNRRLPTHVCRERADHMKYSLLRSAITPLFGAARHGLRICLCLIALWYALIACDAMAGPAVADIQTKSDPQNLTGNKSSFFLWSNLTGPGAAVEGPNKPTTYIIEVGNGQTTIADPIPETRMLITVGKKTYPDAPGNNVGKTMITKPRPPNGAFGGAQQLAQDSSFALDNDNKSYIVESSGNVSNLPDIKGNPEAKFSAKAGRSTGAKGSAAAATWDPGDLPPPSSGYFLLSQLDDQGLVQSMYLLDGMLAPEDASEYQAIAFMGTDSRFTPTFPPSIGDAAYNLWTLTISATGPVQSISDLKIVFDINPLATIIGGGMQEVLTDSTGNPLSSAAVLSRVTGALTVADGMATLAPIDIFPVGTQYHLNQPITYGLAAAAAMSTIPEPCSLSLLMLGVVFVAWRRQHKGRH